MWNAKQKEEAPWKLLLFFFTIRVIRGSLTEYYVRKLFTKCIGFQIHEFFFIPMCVYVHLNKCSILDWSGLEMFVKVLLMEQKCVGSTLRPFLSKKSHSCKNYLCIISTRWISGPEESVLLSGLEDFFFNSRPCFDMTSHVIVKSFQSVWLWFIFSVWKLFCNSHIQNLW